ncbi:MAG: transposase [Mangrovibacterium sp.]
MPSWNYGWNAAYFITICTQHREHWFGEIVSDTDALTCVLLGEIVNTEWLKTFEMRPDMNLWMGEYVIMPNHFHAIIGIGENKYNTSIVQTQCIDSNSVQTQCIASLQQNQFAPQSKNLASIVRGFKIGVTKNTRKINPGFAWQARYHDHIIRDDKSYQRISEYIVNNPLKWTEDKFYDISK